MNSPRNPLARACFSLSRRRCLQAAFAAITGALFPLLSVEAGGRTLAAAPPAREKVRGVNLGGWLVLEKWMTPSVFAGTDAGDEYTFLQKLGAEGEKRLRAHHDTFITEDDFAWIAGCGLNAVRIPIGYWILEGDAPFVAAADKLDWAFHMATKHKLKVLLDLHGAPGSQNGWDHSGKAGAIDWPKKENVARTLDIIEALTKRYGAQHSLWGLELLNEPRWDVPLDVLKDYYQEGYKRVRQHTNKERVAVVLQDSFRPFAWEKFMPEPEYSNVLLDTHLYQCYTDDDRKHDAWQHVQQSVGDWKKQLDTTQKSLPGIVGEWSFSLDPASLQGLDEFHREVAIRAYGDSELLTFETGAGWFYWNYKLEYGSDWNFRDLVKRGVLPAKFGSQPS